MKMPYILLCVLFLCIANASAQNTQTYTVDGVSYELKTEVEGPLTLLWNTIDLSLIHI